LFGQEKRAGRKSQTQKRTSPGDSRREKRGHDLGVTESNGGPILLARKKKKKKVAAKLGGGGRGTDTWELKKPCTLSNTKKKVGSPTVRRH